MAHKYPHRSHLLAPGSFMLSELLQRIFWLREKVTKFRGSWNVLYLNVRKAPSTQLSPFNRHLILHPFLLLFQEKLAQEIAVFWRAELASSFPQLLLCGGFSWQLPPLLSGYWLYAAMSHWGFIFRSVSLFISPFSFPFEASQAASTSAQKGRVHLCTEIRS